MFTVSNFTSLCFRFMQALCVLALAGCATASADGQDFAHKLLVAASAEPINDGGPSDLGLFVASFKSGSPTPVLLEDLVGPIERERDSIYQGMEGIDKHAMSLPSMTGWYPVSVHPDQDKLRSHLLAEYKQAAIDAVEEFGFETVELNFEDTLEPGAVLVKDEGKDVSVIMLVNEDYGCAMTDINGDKRSNCAIGIQAGTFNKVAMPAFLDESQPPSWNLKFPSEHHIRLLQYGTLIPSEEIHAAISERLSDRIFSFIPDSFLYPVLTKNAEPKGYAYWLQGGAEYPIGQAP